MKKAYLLLSLIISFSAFAMVKNDQFTLLAIVNKTKIPWSYEINGNKKTISANKSLPINLVSGCAVLKPNRPINNINRINILINHGEAQTDGEIDREIVDQDGIGSLYWNRDPYTQDVYMTIKKTNSQLHLDFTYEKPKLQELNQ